MMFSIRGNDVDSRSLRCGSTKSTLVPGCLSFIDLLWAIEFLKSASNLVCLAQELSARSLLIGSILVSRFHNFSFISLFPFPPCLFRHFSLVCCRSSPLCQPSVVAFLQWPSPGHSSYLGSDSYCVKVPFSTPGIPHR